MRTVFGSATVTSLAEAIDRLRTAAPA